jgi:hypothetical protein
MFGYQVLLSAGQDRLFFSPSRDFAAAQAVALGQETPVPGYFFAGVDGGSIRLQYAFLYDNTDAVEALLNMYELTGRPDYLARARSNLMQVLSRLDGDFKYRWLTADGQAVYSGMAQGLLLQAVDHYLQVAPDGDEELEPARMGLAQAFLHTTGGSWGPALNSYLGWVIARRVLGLSPELPPGLPSDLEQLRQQVTTWEGWIPRVMSEQHPQYPLLSATPQAYATMSLAWLASSLPERPAVMDLFGSMHAQAQAANYSIYAAYNSLALLYAQRGSAYVDDVFADGQTAWLRALYQTPPHSSLDAVARLQTTAALLQYRARRAAAP